MPAESVYCREAGIHLELERGAQVLECALVLEARLTRLVAPSLEAYHLWLCGRGWLSDGFGNGLSCALDFGAGLTRAIAPLVTSWICIYW